MSITKQNIEKYLSEVKDAVKKNKYRIDRNEKREDNISLFLDYVIDEVRAKEILLSLSVTDFSEILQNEHGGYEYEQLYVFGKDVMLLERNGANKKSVSLYIKFNKLKSCFENGGSYYGREAEEGFLHRMQEGDRVFLGKEENGKAYTGESVYI